MATNFVLVNSPYDSVVPFLKEALPSFMHSPEYEAACRSDDLPGVILAAFGRFLSRLCKTGTHFEEVETGVLAINAVYDWDDSQVQASIRDEFIEAFDGEPDAVRAIRPLLSEPLAEEFTNLLA